MSGVVFEDITNRMGVIIKQNPEIENICQNIFGKSITIQDNSIVIKEYLPGMPFCEINKDEERAFKNEEAKDMRRSNIWTGNIVFFGNFETKNGIIPAVAVETKNGIITYTPSDIMRKIARAAGEAIYEQISCSDKTQGIFLNHYSIMSEVYYDRASGTVGSYLEFELYKRNSAYN